MNYLPNRVYLTSNVAPPPMNPRLQYCLQKYKFATYNENKQLIKSGITNFQSINLVNLPDDKIDIFESHFDNASSTFDLVKRVQNTENEYNLFIKDYKDIHFKVRKKQKKIIKVEKKIKKLEAEIRNLDKEDVSEKQKIQLEIEELKLETEELSKAIPSDWERRNQEFNKIHKAKNIATKRYRKNVDEAYDELTQIKLFIKDGKELEKLSNDFNKLNNNIINEDFDNALINIDILFEKLEEISGTEELANKLDDLVIAIDSEEIDKDKIFNISNETVELFNKEVSWRNKAGQSLADKLDEYDSVISQSIGLRLQARLTKEQAKFVARCKSVHRDISLNF